METRNQPSSKKKMNKKAKRRQAALIQVNSNQEKKQTPESIENDSMQLFFQYKENRISRSDLKNELMKTEYKQLINKPLIS